MINPQSSFIPLFFDDAESDLWQALQQIQPEERSLFIKTILRQALIEDSAKEPLLSENRIAKLSVVEDTDNKELNNQVIQADLPEEHEKQESFSLDSLFEVNVPDQVAVCVEEFDLESLREDKPIRSAGLDYMMKYIIGTEDDETVLEVLRGFSK